jgi:hypothetical protein
MASNKRRKRKKKSRNNRPRPMVKTQIAQPKRMQVPWAATVGCIGCIISYAHPITGMAVAIFGCATEWWERNR